MNLRVAAGATSRSVYFRVYKDDGTANAALVFNSSGLAITYQRDNGTLTTITLVTLASPTAAYASGGFVHRGNGEYRLDLPDAALAAAASVCSVVVAETADLRAEPVVIDLDTTVATLSATLNVKASQTSVDALAATTGKVAGAVIVLDTLVNGTYADRNKLDLASTAGVLVGHVLRLTHTTGGAVEKRTVTAVAGVTVTLASNLTTAAQLNDPVQILILPASPAAVGSPMTLTTGEREAVAVAVEGNLIDEADGQTILNAIVGAIGNSNVDEIALVAAIRADVERVGGTLKLAAGDVGTILGRVDVATSTRMATFAYTPPPTAAAVASAVADEPLTKQTHWVPNSLGKRIQMIESDLEFTAGNVVAATASTVTLDAAAVAQANYYRRARLHIQDGTGGGQSRIILAYGADRVCSQLDEDWVVVPDATSTYAIEPARAVAVQVTDKASYALAAGHGLATEAKQDTILGRLGDFAGAGLNTVKGFLRAIAAKAAGLTPSELSAGTTYDNTADSNEAIRDRGDAAWTTGSGGGGGGGTFDGPLATTISFVDAVGAAVGAVTFTVSGAGSATTDGTGVITVGLAAGTYTVTAAAQSGVLFAPTPITVSSVALAHTITGTAPAAITPAADASQTTAHTITRDGRGSVLPNTVVSFKLVDPDGATGAWVRRTMTATSDGTGLLQVALAKASTYDGWLDGGERVRFTTGSGPTYELPELLGKHGS